MFPNLITNCIAVLIFVILIIAFPIIGAKAGWKKAAYWGGSNLVFYIIGTLIYRFAGTNIATSLAPKFLEIFTKMGFQGLTVDQVLAFTKSLIGPALFLVVFIGGNLILLINYYAWFKKVSGISREGYAKKIVKRAKKNTTVAKIDKNDKKVIKYKVTEADLVKVQSKGYKGLNRAVGCFGLWFAMIPSTIALSQAVIYTTSSQATRRGDTIWHSIGKWSYKVLNTVNTKASWFSFYAGEPVGDDYNSLMSLLRVGTQLCPDWYDSSTKIYWWYYPDGKSTEMIPIDTTTMKNSLTVINTVEGKTIGNLFTKICEVNAATTTVEISEKVDELLKVFNNTMYSWNRCSEALDNDIIGLYMSDNLLKMVPQLIPAPTSQTLINKATIQLLTANEVLNTVQAGLINGGTYKIRDIQVQFGTPLHRISPNNNVKPILKDIIMSYYKYDTDVEETDKTTFSNAMDQFLSLYYAF